MGQLGLRQRQRIARRQAVLFAAGRLFSTKGFEATSLEDVAAAAAISVPTIYTFFQSKQELLLGLLEEDGALLEPKLSALVDDLPTDPVEAFLALGRAIIAEGYDVTHRNVWREILAASMRVGAERRNHLAEIQSVSARYIGIAIDRLRKGGSLSSDLDRDSAVRVLDAAYRFAFRTYLVDDGMSLERMLKLLLSDLKTIINGMK